MCVHAPGPTPITTATFDNGAIVRNHCSDIVYLVLLCCRCLRVTLCSSACGMVSCIVQKIELRHHVLARALGKFLQYRLTLSVAFVCFLFLRSERETLALEAFAASAKLLSPYRCSLDASAQYSYKCNYIWYIQRCNTSIVNIGPVQNETSCDVSRLH